MRAETEAVRAARVRVSVRVRVSMRAETEAVSAARVRVRVRVS